MATGSIGPDGRQFPASAVRSRSPSTLLLSVRMDYSAAADGGFSRFHRDEGRDARVEVEAYGQEESGRRTARSIPPLRCYTLRCSVGSTAKTSI